MSEATGRPNILFLFTDDQRFDALAAAGNPDVITPNMDRLVARGTSFTQCTIMGSTVPAVCCPSRAMLNTGRNLYHAPLNCGEYATMPQTLREAGYATFGTGKWHNERASYARSFSYGGSIFFGGMSNHTEVPVHDFDASGQYSADRQHVGKSFSSELFSDAAIGFLEGYEDDAPFYAYVSYTAPHDPRMPPAEYADLYDTGAMTVPQNFAPAHPFDNGELRIRDEMLAPFPRTPEIVQEHIAAYCAMITHVDAHIGRVLGALEAAGCADNTIVVFAGDNGLAVGQHGLFGKQSMYEHSIRVPLTMAGPGLAAGQTREGLCYLHDVFPTLCELVGLDIPGSVETRSLAPVISGERETMYDTTFHAYRDVQRAVRDGRFKLIEYFVDGVNTTQLFDVVDDPWEQRDLADRASMSAEVSRLRAELEAWQREIDDPLIAN